MVTTILEQSVIDYIVFKKELNELNLDAILQFEEYCDIYLESVRSRNEKEQLYSIAILVEIILTKDKVNFEPKEEIVEQLESGFSKRIKQILKHFKKKD